MGPSHELRVEPDDDGGEDHHRAVVDGAFLVAGGQPAPLFEAVDAAFHDVASGIGRSVEGQRTTRPRGAARALVGALGNGMWDLALMQEPPTAGIAVALVGNEPVWPRAGSSAPARPPDANAVEHRLQLGTVMALSWRNDDGEWPPLAVAGEVKLGRQSAPAASEAFVVRVLEPLFSSA